MKNFKAIITTNKDEKVGQNQRKLVVNLPFELRVEIDKNNQISGSEGQVHDPHYYWAAFVMLD